VSTASTSARRSALVNLDRFNAAFGIGSVGFSEGMVCVPPDRPGRRDSVSA
jgi:hypothetical protein